MHVAARGGAMETILYLVGEGADINSICGGDVFSLLCASPEIQLRVGLV